MTERLADITARIGTVTQLGAVVTAMRGIAASRAQKGRSLIAGIEAFADTIAGAIGRALELLDTPPSRPAGNGPGAHALIAFAVEQGFSGALGDRVFDAVVAETASIRLMIVGTRGAAIAAERGLVAAWTAAMATHAESVSGVANHVADALYGDIAAGRVSRASVVYPRLDGERRISIARLELFPLDLAQFRREQAAVPPLVNFAPEQLVERLIPEYIFARLSEAAMHAYASENQARMEAMSAASSNIDREIDALTQRQNQVRQEELTAEIVELAAGSACAARRS